MKISKKSGLEKKLNSPKPAAKPSVKASGEHPILEVMRRVVLPSVAHSHGHIMPSPEDAIEISGRHNAIFPYEMHAHETFEWVWLIEGYTHLNIGSTPANRGGKNDVVRRLNAGDFCLLPPRTHHVEMYTAQTPEYRSLWFTYFEASVAVQLFQYQPVNHGRVVAHCEVPAPPLVVSLIAALQSELKTGGLHSLAIRRGLLSTLAHVLMRALESNPLDQTHHVLPGLSSYRVLEFLRENYAQEITLDDVARATGKSRAYLASIFKRQTGKTIWEALTEIRLEHARQLLLERRLSVHAVARAVGYANPEHFSRLFLREEGVPPSRYGK